MNAQEEYRISPAHLTLLSRLDNADVLGKTFNLLILRAIHEGITHLVFIDHPPGTEVMIGRTGSIAADWTSIPFRLVRVCGTLSRKSNPPLPWWYKLKLWYWLSFHIRERVDHWFWHPLLDAGQIEYSFYNMPAFASWKRTHPDRIELTFSMDEELLAHLRCPDRAGMAETVRACGRRYGIIDTPTG